MPMRDDAPPATHKRLGEKARDADADEWDFPHVDGYESTDDERCQLLASISALISRMLETHDDDDNSANDSERTVDAQALVLQRTLSQALLELSSEQDNVRRAANAGNALLDQLRAAKAETRAALGQLRKCQHETRRLAQQCDAMERELAQRHAATQPRSTETVAPCCANIEATCQHTAAKWNAIVDENNELKRRCVELENQQTKERAAVRKLQHEWLHAQTKWDRLLLTHGRASDDAAFLTAHVAQLQADRNDAVATRDNLRAAARRLKRDNSALAQKLDAQDALLDSLHSERRAARTTAQVLENRVATLRAETETLATAFAASQAQWDAHKCVNDSDETARLQQHAHDLEQLLDEAQRERTALKMENRALRRLNKAPPAPECARCRKTRTTTTTITTCAELLAADKACRSQQRERAKTFDGVISYQEQQHHDAQRVAATHTEPPLDQDVPQSDMDSSESQTENSAAPEPSDPTTFLHQVAARRWRRYTYTTTPPPAAAAAADPVRTGERMRRSTIADASALEQSSEPRTESGAAAPLYFGLSFLACATAAGILSRR